jgi:hypothetical protein
MVAADGNMAAADGSNSSASDASFLVAASACGVGAKGLDPGDTATCSRAGMVGVQGCSDSAKGVVASKLRRVCSSRCCERNMAAARAVHIDGVVGSISAASACIGESSASSASSSASFGCNQNFAKTERGRRCRGVLGRRTETGESSSVCGLTPPAVGLEPVQSPAPDVDRISAQSSHILNNSK